MEICKTDIKNMTRYLLDAAKLYDKMGDSTVAYNRARLIRILVKKINRKLELL